MSGGESFVVTARTVGEGGEAKVVQIGTAVKTADGYALHLEEVSVGGVPVVYAQIAAPASKPAAKAAAGKPSVEDLQAMAERARRNLADPRKAKWHDDERALLAEIESELERLRSAAVRQT